MADSCIELERRRRCVRAAIAAATLSPVEVDARGAGAHRALGAAPAGARTCCDPSARCSRRAPVEARWLQGEPLRPARRRARHDQGQHRHRRATRRRWAPPPPSLSPAAADAPPAARLREAGGVMLGQDHDARLRHAVLGPVELPPAGAQPVGPRSRRRAAPAPAPARRPRPATGRCTSAPTSAARCACRPAGAASSRLKPSLGRIPIDPPYTGRAAGPMTRTRGRRGADDGLLCLPDRARQHEPALAGHRLAGPRPARALQGPAHRPAARRRLRPGGRARSARGRDGRRARLRARRRHRRAHAALHADRRCSTAWTTSGACARTRHGSAAARAPRQGAALHPALGRQAARARAAKRCSRASSQFLPIARGHGRRLPQPSTT